MKEEIKRIYFAYIFLFLKNATPIKIHAEYIFPHFLAIFALFKLKKGLIFGIFILDLSLKWLLDAFNIHFIYIEQKIFIFILVFFFLN